MKSGDLMRMTYYGLHVLYVEKLYVSQYLGTSETAPLICQGEGSDLDRGSNRIAADSAAGVRAHASIDFVP